MTKRELINELIRMMKYEGAEITIKEDYLDNFKHYTLKFVPDIHYGYFKINEKEVNRKGIEDFLDNISIEALLNIVVKKGDVLYKLLILE